MDKKPYLKIRLAKSMMIKKINNKGDLVTKKHDYFLLIIDDEVIYIKPHTAHLLIRNNVATFDDDQSEKINKYLKQRDLELLEKKKNE